MDAPTLKLVEWLQELWETIFRDFTSFAVELCGEDPSRIEVQMPPIMGRDVAQVAAMMTGLVPVLDPHGENRALYRFVFGEILDAMGKVNTPELLNQIFGESWRTPFETQQALMQQQMQMAQQAAQANMPLNRGGQDGRAAQAAQINMRQAAEQRTVPHARAGGDLPGGPSTWIARSGDRANARYQQQVREGAALLEAIAEGRKPPELSKDLEESLREALAAYDRELEGAVAGPE